MFGPQPRSYDYALPQKVKLGALRAALAQKLNDRTLVVVDKLESARQEDQVDRSDAASRSASTGKTLVIDVKPDEALRAAARNIAGVRLVPTAA